jgi:imidazoleglycerol phosphate dehydratase HisB
VSPTATDDRSTQPASRRAELRRTTKETDVELALDLDGGAAADVETGIGFLDHLLTAFACHGRFGLRVRCRGDLHVDDHHTAEDVALVLGAALDQALGERRGIERFGDALIPMDEALARCAVDLGGRPFAVVNLELRREAIGALATENMSHVVRSLAQAARAAIHLDVLRGENDHHKVEAAFKALGRALRAAVTRTAGASAVPSTKGVL